MMERPALAIARDNLERKLLGQYPVQRNVPEGGRRPVALSAVCPMARTPAAGASDPEAGRSRRALSPGGHHLRGLRPGGRLGTPHPLRYRAPRAAARGMGPAGYGLEAARARPERLHS